MNTDNKLRDLNREYWGRIHDMCEGTTVKPWECVRYFNAGFVTSKSHFVTFKSHPDFSKYTDSPAREWRMAVAILKDDQTGLGRPVWAGDRVYARSPNVGMVSGAVITKNGDEYVAAFEDGTLLCVNSSIMYIDSYLTWTPSPKPKRTFTLNGVELPCPDRNVTDNYVSLIYFQNGKARASNDFFFGSEEDCFDFCDKLNQIFESAYPERVE